MPWLARPGRSEGLAKAYTQAVAAQLGADVLDSAELRGMDSHGVSNMLRGYIAGYS